MTTIRRRARKAINRILAPSGLELTHRTAPSHLVAHPFYEQAPGCQIDHLAHLLEFFLGRTTSGVFVEVGAYDGRTYSNTWGLAARGWTGLLVEPVPELAQAARRNHLSHPAIRVIEVAIAAADGVVMLNVAGPYTTANLEVTSRVRAGEGARPIPQSACMISARATSLDALLEREKIDPGFDLLVIDVEGFEGEVFGGFALHRWRPRMLILELKDVHPFETSTRKVDARLASTINAHGYQIVYKDVINTVFVRTDVRDQAFEQDLASATGSV